MSLSERVYRDDGQEDYNRDFLNVVLGLPVLPSIAEVNSIPRVAAQALTVGMRPGFSIDIGTINPNTGASWNLENESEFKYLKTWRNEEKPFLLCGSPPCNAFSKIQTWNRSWHDPKKHKEMMRVGRLHLQRSCERYRAQMADGLYFLHEYPNGSSSVQEPCLESLLKEPGVYRVKGPMCFWGMTAKDEQGEGFVKKETWWVTNSPCIAQELDRECTNVRSQQVGE